MHELLPTTSDLGLMINPADPALANTQLKDFQAAANTLGVKLHVLNASTK